jgi:hypothetical protein
VLRVAVSGPRELDVFAVGVNGAIYHRMLTGFAWNNAWEELGGDFSADEPIDGDAEDRARGLARRRFLRAAGGAAFAVGAAGLLAACGDSDSDSDTNDSDTSDTADGGFVPDSDSVTDSVTDSVSDADSVSDTNNFSDSDTSDTADSDTSDSDTADSDSVADSDSDN